jgi:hypothetical protein
MVLGAYLWVGRVLDWRGPAGFLRWTTGYLRSQHPIQIQLPDHLSKGVIGVTRALVEAGRIEAYLTERFSYREVLLFYGALGLAAAAGVAVWLWRRSREISLRKLARDDPLFAVSLASLLAWSVFVFVWEPLGYYWSLALFFALLCAGAVARSGAPRRGARFRVALAAAVALSAWNVYASHARDRIDGINAPEPLVRSIEEQLGPADVFVVLARDWSAGMGYDLIFEYLAPRPRNPGIFLLEDLVLAPGSVPWRERLASRIVSVLGSGGRIFVSEELLAAESYGDLAKARDPFATFVEEAYRNLDGPRIGREIEELFDAYRLVPSTFHVGRNAFLELRPAR